ncbi:ABC transporter permease [Christensenella intestinihominis]|uniref:ABC transporter permease n=1 Tax=Christensenella intestinihominis TaxID=1851429 RepID=UPI000A5B6395|nr:ABC transporter permease [Christensenella intestinihominis]
MEKQMTLNKGKKNFLSKYSLIFILVIFMIVCTFANENFLTSTNLINVFRQQSVVIMLALGEMILIIAGLLDLSCGSVVAFAGVVSVLAYKSIPNLFVGFAVAIGVALAINALNGLMVTKFKTPPFIATLATQAIARGAALYITGGQNVYEIGDYNAVGQGSFGPIPIPVIIMLIALAVMIYVMRYTRFGRSTYAVGGNEEAANASGIKVNAVKMKAYLVNGILVGVAALVFMSRVNGGLPNGAKDYEFDALTATIIGGTSFTGGVGNPIGTLLGALIVGFLGNIMNLMSVDSYIQQIVRGAIIAFAVIIDIYSKDRQTSKSNK